MILTQEIISHLLGVRREGVTVSAGRLQDAGVISYVRGHIRILDRQKLEACACECYTVVRDEYERLLTL
jgi:Mn-dependent DtxR family transcriptional regulator